MFQPIIDGIIFDLDGTLVNSEPLHMQAWLGVLAQNGLQFDEHWFEQWIGLSDRVLAQSVVKEYRPAVGVEVLQEQKRNTYHRLARQNSVLFSGVEEGLSYLSSRCKLAMATSSSDADAAAVFANTGIDRFFQTIVTSDMVESLKPAPDCYQLAVKRLGLDVSRCLAVEDSPAGVKAAKTAGLLTFVVGNSQPADRLKEADLYFNYTHEALEAVKNVVI